ncbi:MAG: VWA domain-containing protein [Caldilineae bacterium]|nr:MAG: VWA domain-containing protein [Caldilineae bacterium]
MDDGRKRAEQLLRNLVHFGRVLRAQGIPVATSQLQDLAQALNWIDLGKREDVHAAARTILVNRPEHLALFDQLFTFFWEGLPVSPQIEQGNRNGAGEPDPFAQRLVWKAPENRSDAAEDDGIAQIVRTYSGTEVLRRRDFATLTEAELAQLQRLMADLRWDLAQRRVRRRQPAASGDILDMRRTLRRSLRHGGEVFTLARQARKHKPRPLVVLCDISGSMERYARVFLQFLYAVSHSLRQVECFVFSTRLTRITRQLQQGGVDEALQRASRAVEDWAGGTRIGAALRTFNREWSGRVLGRGAIVLLISDGWDRGDPELLAQEIARLGRSSHRLIWLNPLLASPGYEPLTRGMQAALPHVDALLPVHNLVSLEQLAEALRGDWVRG